MKKAYFIPRALLFFVIFFVVGVGIYRFASHHYKNVAEWGEPDSSSALIYEEETFFLAGKIGEDKLSAKKFPKNEVLGEVTPENFFDNAKPFVVWSVEGKINFLIVTNEKTEYLYYRNGVSNPAEPETESAAG